MKYLYHFFIFLMLVSSLSPLWGDRGDRFLEVEIQTIDDYLTKKAEELPIPGFSVSVVKQGEIIFTKGYGVEVLGEEKPMTADSPVGIGSITKSFTALAVMRLVESGDIHLDDPVQNYLPWFTMADKEASREITIRSLLGNASGIPSIDATIFSRDNSANAMENLVRSLSGYSLKRKPGTAFEYSNENWTVLGLVIEVVTGRKYVDVIQEDICIPLGMDLSTTDINRIEEMYRNNPMVHGHFTGYDKAIRAPFFYNPQYVPAGMFFHSTARDMAAYMLMYLSGGSFNDSRIISPEGVRTMFEPVISTPGYTEALGGDGGTMDYALGWVIDQVEGRRLVYHAGGTLKASSFLIMDPQAGTGVCILTNIDLLNKYKYTGLFTLGNNILHMLAGEKPTDFGIPRQDDPNLARPFISPPEEYQSELPGTYDGKNGQTLVVTLEDGAFFGSTYARDTQTGKVKMNFLTDSHIIATSLSDSRQVRIRKGFSGQIKSIVFEGNEYLPYSEDTDVVTISFPRGGFSGLPQGWSVRWDDEKGYFYNKEIPGQKMDVFYAQTEDNLALLEKVRPGAKIIKAGGFFIDDLGFYSWNEQAFVIETKSGAESVMLVKTTLDDDGYLVCVYTSPGQFFSAGIMNSLSFFMKKVRL